MDLFSSENPRCPVRKITLAIHGGKVAKRIAKNLLAMESFSFGGEHTLRRFRI
jgi:hypothetical protein